MSLLFSFSLNAEADKELNEKAEKVRKQIFYSKLNCTPDDWSRYEFGNYYAEYAIKYKTTPYKLVFGSHYEKRNIDSWRKDEIIDNYFKYFSHLNRHLEAYGYYFNNLNEDKQEQVFNRVVKNDNTCYNKLK